MALWADPFRSPVTSPRTECVSSPLKTSREEPEVEEGEKVDLRFDGRLAFAREALTDMDTSPRRGGYGMPIHPRLAEVDSSCERIVKLLNAENETDLAGVDAARIYNLRNEIASLPEGLPKELRGAAWMILLGVEKRSKKMPDINEYLEGVQLNERNQRVIQNDVERTRAHIPFFKESETRSDMEVLLTAYCQLKNISYKQGLNEVLAPMMYLGIGRVNAFSCFTCFLARYLPIFGDDEFTSLQCSFYLFKHLLLYHDPGLALFLDGHGIYPELYVTPWFMTLFASKTQIDHLMYLWDLYMSEDDRFFYCFYALSLLIGNRSLIYKSDPSQVPEVLSQLTVTSYNALRETWKLAKELKQNTPSTFAFRLSASQTRKVVHLVNLTRLEEEQAFVILPQEVLRHSFLNAYTKTIAAPWKLLLFDLRDRIQYDNGRLPTSMHVEANFDPSSLLALILGEDMASRSYPRIKSETTNELCSLTPLCHISLLIDNFGDRAQVNLLNKVYDFLVHTTKIKHVSIVRGGYQELHRVALANAVELIDHNPDHCSECVSSNSLFAKRQPIWTPSSIGPMKSKSDVTNILIINFNTVPLDDFRIFDAKILKLALSQKRTGKIVDEGSDDDVDEVDYQSSDVKLLVSRAKLVILTKAGVTGKCSLVHVDNLDQAEAYINDTYIPASPPYSPLSSPQSSPSSTVSTPSENLTNAPTLLHALSKSFRWKKKSKLMEGEVRVLALFPLKSIVKITANRTDAKQLCFYFGPRRTAPRARLRLLSKLEADECITLVKSSYLQLSRKTSSTEV